MSKNKKDSSKRNEALNKPVEATDYNFRLKDCLIGAQMLFVAFGALVLVPILTGLDPNVALFTAGFGTLVFQLITGGKVPIFIASSFAFIAPISYGVSTWGIPATLSGLVAAGFFFILIGITIRIKGQEFITKLMPPIVTGPVIMVIGLVLAPVAVNMAKGLAGTVQAIPQSTALPIAGFSLFVTVMVTLKAKGALKLLPILSGITAGYLLSWKLGLINFAPVFKAQWFAFPNFTFPQWNSSAIWYIVPVAIAPAIEHVGDVLAIAKVTGRN
jgi:uracil permease